MLQGQSYDILFVDVQMPEMSGIELVKSLGEERFPMVVFVTAYDTYAVAAFEAEAVDFLLKPFSNRRFETTLARAKTRVEEQRLRLRMNGPASQLGVAPQRTVDRLVLKSARKIEVLDRKEITWIQSTGVYVTLHQGEKNWLYRTSLTSLSQRLDRRAFVRVHRSAVVNLNHLTKLLPLSHGDFLAVMRDGSSVRVSRSYRAELEQFLGSRL